MRNSFPHKYGKILWMIGTALLVLFFIAVLLLWGMRTVSSMQEAATDPAGVGFRSGSGESVRLQKLPGDKGMAVFLPSCFDGVSVVSPRGLQVYIDGQEYPDGTPVGDAAAPGEHTLCIRDRSGGETVPEETFTVYTADGVDALMIRAQKGSVSAMNADPAKKTTLSGLCRILPADGGDPQEVACTLSGHGNVTWKLADKRSYNVELSQALPLLGMEAQRDWVLVSCVYDESYIRNRIAFESARALGCPYTPQERFVDLYIDGEYLGLYDLTHKIDMRGGTFDRAGADGEWLLEFDYYGEKTAGTGGFYTDRKYVSVKYPVRPGTADLETIRARVMTAEEAVLAHREDCFRYLDQDSFAAQYLLNEAYVQKDIDFSSQFFYKLHGDPLFYAGPVWDFDRLLGDDDNTLDYGGLEKTCLWIPGMTGGEDVESGWFKELWEIPGFRERVETLYTERLSGYMAELAAGLPEVWQRQIDASVRMDRARYGRDAESFRAEIRRTEEWIGARREFLDSVFSRGEERVTLTFYTRQIEDNSHDLICLLTPGTELAALPAAEDVTGWVYEDGTPLRAGDVITKSAVVYPVYAEGAEYGQED